MKKNPLPRFTLHRETLRRLELDDAALAQARINGARSVGHDTNCDTSPTGPPGGPI